MVKVFALCSCFFFATVNKVHAWGPRGHKIISQIAEKYLDKNVKDSLNFYLDDITLVKASYWMDEVTMNINYDFMKPWHFVTVPIDKTYVRTKTPDIINVLENVITKLKHHKAGTKKEVLLALKILIHLMGDLHQPLHCGLAKDKNGEAIKLRFFYKATNLHEVWDSEILEYKAMTVEDCHAIAMTLSKTEIAILQNTDILKCMEESRALLSYVYDFKGNKLDDEYVDKNTRVIKMQLVKAGIRLAGVLNQVFKKSGPYTKFIV